MPRVLAALAAPVALAAASLLAGCNTAKPAPQYVGRMAMVVPEDSASVLARLRSEASAQGGTVVQEGADAFSVDFGVQTRRIPIPTEYGLWGTNTCYRETEVHETATYGVRAVQGGTLVSITHNPVYWHPDIKVWLPGPHDMVPGMDALRDMGGTQ